MKNVPKAYVSFSERGERLDVFILMFMLIYSNRNYTNFFL